MLVAVQVVGGRARTPRAGAPKPARSSSSSAGSLPKKRRRILKLRDAIIKRQPLTVSGMQLRNYLKQLWVEGVEIKVGLWLTTSRLGVATSARRISPTGELPATTICKLSKFIAEAGDNAAAAVQDGTCMGVLAEPLSPFPPPPGGGSP